jgi:hypothetical protein
MSPEANGGGGRAALTRRRRTFICARPMTVFAVRSELALIPPLPRHALTRSSSEVLLSGNE